MKSIRLKADKLIQFAKLMETPSPAEYSDNEFNMSHKYYEDPRKLPLFVKPFVDYVYLAEIYSKELLSLFPPIEGDYCIQHGLGAGQRFLIYNPRGGGYYTDGGESSAAKYDKFTYGFPAPWRIHSWASENNVAPDLIAELATKEEHSLTYWLTLILLISQNLLHPYDKKLWERVQVEENYIWTV